MTRRSPASVIWMLAALMLAGCSNAEDSASSASKHSSSTSLVKTGSASGTATATGNDVDPRATPCAELIDQGWQPPEEEAPDISWDPVSGDNARITFTGEQLTLDIVDDPKCRELPVIGKLIGQILDDAASSQ